MPRQAVIYFLFHLFYKNQDIFKEKKINHGLCPAARRAYTRMTAAAARFV